MKKNHRLQKWPVFLLAVFLAVVFAMPALAAVPERPKNLYVLDSADVLSEETEREIVSENQKLFRETGAEIVVAAVDFLDGQSIEDYVDWMFNSWGVGSAERNNGILLVLAVAEDNYYAQSGYGIDKTFDGAKLGDLLYEYLEPDFAKADYDAGVKKFFSATLSELEDYYRDYHDDYDNGEFTQGGSNYDYGSYDEDSGFSPGGVISFLIFIAIRVAIIFVFVLVIVIIVRALTRGGGGGGGAGGGGGGFWTGMFIGRSMNRHRWYHRPPPPPGPGGFGGFGGFGGSGHSGGFSHGGRSGGGIGRSGGFSHGGGSHGGGAGRR